jgi:hypothetical protein
MRKETRKVIYLRIYLPGMGILVVNVSARHCSIVILQLDIPPQLRLLFS